MESKKALTYTYKIDDSAKRMDEILNACNDDYEENGYHIPSRNNLTYKNGYYVDVTALFIDIIDSSKLTEIHRRPTLAKMYRCFLSECVAILNGEVCCKEININGDCVWGVFETPFKSNIDTVVTIAAQLRSMVDLLNRKLEKRGYETLSVGIGIDLGRALMIKAGYSGSGINEVVWMGDVVNSACHLSNKAGRNGRKKMIITEVLYDNLNDHNRGLFTKYYDYTNGVYYYEGDIYNVGFDEWMKNNM